LAKNPIFKTRCQSQYAIYERFNAPPLQRDPVLVYLLKTLISKPWRLFKINLPQQNKPTVTDQFTLRKKSTTSTIKN